MSAKQIYLVIDTARWGYSHTIVRAESESEAKRLACGPYAEFATKAGIKVMEMDPKGQSKVLWCHDKSPDTPREDWEP